MNRSQTFFCSFAVVLLSFAFSASSSFGQALPDRKVAITIDDLPAASANMSGTEVTAMTAKLLATLQKYNVPAVGFVNEKKLYQKWGEVDERIKALNMWLDAGLELGNHTYAHTSLNTASLQEWEDAVIQGENVTRILMTQHGKKLRYLRHPFLDAGRDLETRRQAEAFLTARGYIIAPVTLDAWDWYFAGVYDDAKRRSDTAAQQEIVSSYLAHHAEMFDYDEKLSKSLVGYEPNQILLLHGNNLEADHIGELLDLLKKRGYSFITLNDALTDEIYSLPDTYVGEGTGWLEHWAITRGQIPQGAPPFPKSIADRAKALHQPQP